MGELLAGVGRSDITPAPGTPQGGWGAQTHQRGLGADLPFYATALVLKDSGQVVAIIDVDAIGFDEKWTCRILEAVVEISKIPRERVRFSCTHTHSGPNTFRLKTISEGLEMALGYLSTLPERIAGAVWQAQQCLQPVRCASGAGRCEINVNRRLKLPSGRIVVGNNWEGPADPTVRVIRFDNPDGKPAAIILHYACHPTTIAWQNQYFTPDYPGIARRTVEEQIGCPCIFLQGAAGNVTPRRGFTGNLETYRRAGRLLGLEASKVALGIETLPHRQSLKGVIESGAPIALYNEEPLNACNPDFRVVSRMIQLPLKTFLPPDQLETEAEVLRQDLARLRREGNEKEISLATARATQAGMRAERARMYYGKSHMDWQLQGIRVSSVALLSIPGEPFTEINEQIVGASPFSETLFSGYSNGGFGYIPIASAYEDGGYEVETSPFAPQAAEIVVRESAEVLHKLWE